MSCPQRRAGRPAHRTGNGFTLLEVLLTLAMSVVLMVLIGGVLQFYARDMTDADLEVRQVQLAAAVMQMIEDDLRAAQHTQPVDTSGLKSLLASAAAVGGSGSGGGGSGGSNSEDDLSAAGVDSETDTAEQDSTMTDTASLNLTSGVAVLQTPGLVGNQTQIQLDVSRLPRLEEYVSMLNQQTGGFDDVPSDLKTVAYYVQAGGITGGVDDPLSPAGGSAAQARGGLVRRSLDRAVTMQAATTGSVSRLGQTGELLAPEIVAIEFAYWDGATWQIEWNSDAYGELPLAVRISVGMRDPTATGSQGSAAAAGEAATRTFTHIVRLPLARPIQSESGVVTGAGR